MTEQPRAQTPRDQIQHNPPSLPASPLPKRVKKDDLATTTNIETPTMSTNHPQTLTANNTESNTLPGVASLLPSMALQPQNGTSTSDVPPLLIQRLTPEATAPTRGSLHAAGYDLYASAPCSLKAKSKALISTGLAIAVPPGTYGRVAPRSGLASKHFLDTGAGVIDADYRGEVKVLMFNFSDVDYEVKTGERVAQLVLERIVTPDVVVVEKLEESVRGVGGFGSTGYI